MSSLPVRSLILDFGRVIGYFDHGRTARRLAPHSRFSEAQIIDYLYPDDLEDAYEKGLVDSGHIVETLRREFDLRCSDQEIREAVADIFWPNEELCALIPRWKSKYRLVLGSNTNELHASHFRRQFGEVLGHFDGMILSHEIGVRKPQSRFFERCVEKAGCAPGSCLFIDDLSSNVAGARAAGLQALLYQDLPTLVAELRQLGIE